jgi:hypothetical protein
MKHLFIRLLSFLIILGFCSQTFAMPPKPVACPKAALIKAYGLTYTDFDEGSYTVFQINDYGTRHLWAFALGEINASSAQEALSIGYTVLNSVNGNPRPTAIPSENVWACIYTNNSGIFSIAFTPIPVASHFNHSIKQHLK